MNFDAVGSLSIVLCSSIFWIFIFSKKSNNALINSFFCWSLFIALWSVGYGITLAGIFGYETTLIWNKYCQAMAVLIGPFFFRFSYTLIEEQEKQKSIFNFYLLFGVTNAIALFFTDLYVKGLWSFGNYRYQPEGGPLYFVFTTFFVWCTLHGYYVVLRAYKKFEGIKKKQVTLWIWATSVAYFGGITLFLQGYKIPFPSTGVYLILAYVFIMGYSVIRYKFLDIEVIIKRTLIFAGFLSAGLILFFALNYVFGNLLGEIIGISQNVTAFMAFILVILFYHPIENWLINVTDKFLFQKKFNLMNIVKEASEAIALVQSLKWLSRRIVAFLVSKCRLKNVAGYIRDDHGNFYRSALRGYKFEEYPIREIKSNFPLIEHLKKTRVPLEINSLKSLFENENDEARRAHYQTLIDFMGKAKAEVVIPSFLRRRIEEEGSGKMLADEDDVVMRSLLVLGPKKSDEPYSNEELDIFYTLAQESAIAIENARLYDEAIQKQKELSEINEALQNTQANLIVAEKNATMVGMAKAIAHEINNPLATMEGRAGFITRKHAKKIEEYIHHLPEKDRVECTAAIHNIVDDAGRIKKSAHRISIVIQTLTNILKESNGEMGPLSLIVVCREAIEAARFSTYEENLTGCDISMDVAANVTIQGNLDQLLQVFVNLIKNAFEAMDPNTERKIKIKGKLDSDNPRLAVIEFSDNGPGVPAHVLDKIWSQGFSTKPTPENVLKSSGQGQGLYICKHMIESVHGGQIYIGSSGPEGTTFVIKLPLAQEQVAS